MRFFVFLTLAVLLTLLVPALVPSTANANGPTTTIGTDDPPPPDPPLSYSIGSGTPPPPDGPDSPTIASTPYLALIAIGVCALLLLYLGTRRRLI